MTESTLRFLTCGHVDDGKSTLIGRLLFDLDAVASDHLAQATYDGVVNLAQITDGLEDERRKGITIDVAYRYFRHGERRFIVADAPGHLEYLRNMAVAASNSDVALILVDVTHGLREQTLRHAHVAAMFGIRHFVIVVNKMDAAHYSAEAFNAIRSEFLRQFSPEEAGNRELDITFIPASALKGDNIARSSEKMGWYKGLTVLDYLLKVEPEEDIALRTRLAVQQQVVAADGRIIHQAWLAGTGTLAKGAVLYPAGKGHAVTVDCLYHSGAEVKEVEGPAAVAFTCAQGAALPVGTVLTSAPDEAQHTHRLRGTLLWLDEENAPESRNEGVFKLHHVEQNARFSLAPKNAFLHQADITLSAPVAFDTHADFTHTRQFILIHPETQRVQAVGMVG